jgi:DNA modification methylase
MLNKILLGDNIETLKTIPDNFINCCITSPPYYGLRDYGIENQIGLENTPEEYIQRLVIIFKEVKRVLREDGTLWLNIADTYAGSENGAAHYPESANTYKQQTNKGVLAMPNLPQGKVPNGCKSKDLIGIPWLLAFASRADGWYLRQEIIWHKPNPMPESVTDRCTKSHESIFLLSKSNKYYFNSEAIKENAISPPSIRDRANENSNIKLPNAQQRFSSGEREYNADGKRNKRDVWTVSINNFRDTHFATFPEKLILPCVLSGCPENGIVLDPFLGSGTTALVAIKNMRKYIGCEINPDYVKIAEERLAGEKGLFDE